jgi:hypothetical protein
MLGLIRDTCPVFKTGSTNQTKNKFFLRVLCVLERPTGAGERKNKKVERRYHEN